MSRRRYFEEQRSGGGAIYHYVETEIDPGDAIRLFYLMRRLYTILHHICYKTYICYLISYSSFLTLFYSIESLSPLFRTRRLSKRDL